jgi:hypothetical protein
LTASPSPPEKEIIMPATASARPRRKRITLPLPEGVTARRCTASGRKGATRWDCWLGPPPAAPDDFAGYLGDLVRWMPEGTWSWQPAGTYTAIVAGTSRPEEVEEGTLAECGAALARAAAAAALKAAGLDPGDLAAGPDGCCPVCGLASWGGTCRGGHGPAETAAWLAG